MSAIAEFIQQHSLPAEYLNTASKYFEPFAKHCEKLSESSNQPLFIGINGCQGSGKTTLSDYLVAWFKDQGISALAMSIDDFYLSHSERAGLAQSVHPLFQTRGVPGTHNYTHMFQVLDSLKQGDLPLIPRFNKATDNPFPKSDWKRPSNTPNIVIIEGWCWGARGIPNDTSLDQPINELEALEDDNSQWRRYANNELIEHLEPLYQFIDIWGMLKAPSFSCVYQWRMQQENALKKALEKRSGDTPVEMSGVMTEQEIKRFVLHYQRITEDILKRLPYSADVVWDLDESRSINRVHFNKT